MPRQLRHTPARRPLPVVRGRMNRIRVEIPGRPSPNVRLTRRQTFKQSPPVERYLNYLHEIKWRAKEQMQRQSPLSGRMAVRVEIHITGSAMNRRNRPWDIGNVEKVVLDGLNGIAWGDDWAVMESNPVLIDRADQDRVIVEAWECE